MADMNRSVGLRTIFSFFLGLMLTAFIGVGVYTFHMPPKMSESRIRELDHRLEEIRDERPLEELSSEDREQIREIRRERKELTDAAQEARGPWALRTSIILIVFATLAMAVSLVRAEQLRVISNGLLLGGVFTMLYGIGWIVATETSVTRFLVMMVSLLITVGLGYLRFVRRGRIAPRDIVAARESTVELRDIETRLHALEERLDAAARAIGRGEDRPGH